MTIGPVPFRRFWTKAHERSSPTPNEPISLPTAPHSPALPRLQRNRRWGRSVGASTVFALLGALGTSYFGARYGTQAAFEKEREYRTEEAKRALAVAGYGAVDTLKSITREMMAYEAKHLRNANHRLAWATVGEPTFPLAPYTAIDYEKLGLLYTHQSGDLIISELRNIEADYFAYKAAMERRAALVERFNPKGELDKLPTTMGPHMSTDPATWDDEARDITLSFRLNQIGAAGVRQQLIDNLEDLKDQRNIRMRVYEVMVQLQMLLESIAPDFLPPIAPDPEFELYLKEQGEMARQRAESKRKAGIDPETDEPFLPLSKE